MTTHSAKSLFDKNIDSAKTCVSLYDSVSMLQPSLDVNWLLRAAVVFAVSSLDAFFHDKIRYRAGRFKIESLPESLKDFEIKLNDVNEYKKYTKRPGNFIRNMVVRHYATRPLQKRRDIEEALKLVGINALWSTIEPHSPTREMALKRLNEVIQRRNQIAHEGDRAHARKSAKKLRNIGRVDADFSIKLVTAVVARIEHHFPK